MALDRPGRKMLPFHLLSADATGHRPPREGFLSDAPRPPRYAPLDLAGTRPYPLEERENLVSVAAFGRPVGPGASTAEFLRSLPDFLGARALRDLAAAIAAARRRGAPVVFAMGAHVVKVGCGPLIVDLLERGVVTALCVNGAFAIHDYEIALQGETSEDVARTIRDGSFGWARETGQAFARAARLGALEGIGLGRAVGLEALGLPHAGKSVLATCARLGLPCSVHVAIGTDTVHMHPGLSGADLGAASHLDFRIAASVVKDLEGGVWTNIGSAVVLPEVFLKLISIARNLGARLDDVTAANLDMLRHYRTSANVIGRPVKRGIEVTGHHEILIPLLRVAVLDALAGEAAP
jgi:hypothetical protein